MNDLRFRLWLLYVETKHRLGLHEGIPFLYFVFPDDNLDEEPVLMDGGRRCLVCEEPC